MPQIRQHDGETDKQNKSLLDREGGFVV